MGVSRKLLSSGFEEWENPVRPIAATPVLILAGSGVGWVATPFFAGDVVRPITTLTTALFALIAGYVVLAYLDTTGNR